MKAIDSSKGITRPFGAYTMVPPSAQFCTRNEPIKQEK
jgi:hypothetical protein